MATAREVYTVLGNETLWQTAQRCHQLLRQANIPYAVAGGVAVCVYGYQRNTVDLDLLIRPADQPAVRALLEQAGFAWSDERHEFSTPAGVVVQLLLTGQPAGPG